MPSRVEGNLSRHPPREAATPDDASLRVLASLGRAAHPATAERCRTSLVVTAIEAARAADCMPLQQRLFDGARMSVAASLMSEALSLATIPPDDARRDVPAPRRIGGLPLPGQSWPAIAEGVQWHCRFATPQDAQAAPQPRRAGGLPMPAKLTQDPL